MAIIFTCVECKAKIEKSNSDYMEAGEEMKRGEGWVYRMDGWHCRECISKDQEPGFTESSVDGM